MVKVDRNKLLLSYASTDLEPTEFETQYVKDNLDELIQKADSHITSDEILHGLTCACDEEHPQREVDLYCIHLDKTQTDLPFEEWRGVYEEPNARVLAIIVCSMCGWWVLCD